VKIIFVISEDWYFLSHRLPLAQEAHRRGWDVLLITRLGEKAGEIEDHGLQTFHVELERGGVNPFKDLRYASALWKIYRREKPDIVHHVAMKPCLYGSLAAWWARVPCVVNALAGMGYVFVSRRRLIRLIRHPLKWLFRSLFNRKTGLLILQNPDDVWMLVRQMGVCAERIRTVRGSGVDLAAFSPANEARGRDRIPVAVMVSRLLVDKGVSELIGAADLLKWRGCLCRVVLVGDADKFNPNAIDQNVVDHAVREGFIEWWGRRSNVASIYRDADMAVLPSYREGFPKSLMEAAACGLPIVTTDMPGCREMVRPTSGGWKSQGVLKIGSNGILVEARNAETLAAAIEWLVVHGEERREMGRQSRALAEREFGIEQVVTATFGVYDELMDTRAGVD
jgi:glycosyltransferase involved in cell wall biosynthesis